MNAENVKALHFVVLFLLYLFFATPVMARYPDLAGYWNFNNSTLDLSGNDSTGTIYGSANWATGKVGKAFSFNGNTYIDCGWNSSLSINDNISIELWFNPQAWVSGNAAQIINKWTSTADANYVMYFFGDTGGINYKKIGFIANAGGAWQAVSPYYLIPALNTWYHIVWTYNSASGGCLYVNGVSQGSSTGSGVLAANSASLNIGALSVFSWISSNLVNQ